MAVNFPTVRPSTSEPTRLFDPEQMMQWYLRGVQLKQARNEADERSMRLRMEMDRYEQLKKEAELNLELEKLKSKKSMIEVLATTPAREEEIPGPPVGEDGPYQGALMRTVPHDPINFRSDLLGIDTEVQPMSLQDTLAQSLRQKAAEAEIERGKSLRPVQPSVGRLFGLPEDVSSIPSEFINKLPAVERDVTLPPELGGGTASASEAGLRETVFKEKAATGRTAMTNRTALSVAGMRQNLANKGLPPEAIDLFANQVATGQIQITNIPDRQIRLAVLQQLGSTGTAIPDKTIIGKMNGFTDALAAIDKVRQSVDAISQINAAEHPVDFAMALRQFDVERMGLSRSVGRSLGEKGVFTDQDKADFAKILGEGMPITALWPEISRNRLANLDKFMNSVYDRQFSAYEQRVGARLKLGHPASRVPDSRLPTVQSQIRTVRDRATFDNLPVGEVFYAPDGRKMRKVDRNGRVLMEEVR